MSENHDSGHDRPHRDAIRRRNLIALVVLAALVLAGGWKVSGLRHSVLIEQCMESGHGNCLLADAQGDQ